MKKTTDPRRDRQRSGWASWDDLVERGRWRDRAEWAAWEYNLQLAQQRLEAEQDQPEDGVG